MLPQWIIEKKRDGKELTNEEISSFIERFTSGEIPDYQMSALAMAIYFRGMTPRETAALTKAMLYSGDLVDTSAIKLPKIDKHSTGGIGDKVSLILAPLVAACGLAVPMISGRGLGITGGTLDKLESIPGYRTNLSEAEFIKVIADCGCSITGQTGSLAPADKKLYALRDVTATVPSIPLIVASIMSKKLAEGIDSLVLDVKFGSGAFMKTQEEARKLALAMIDVGHEMGKSVSALLTDMNQPLGKTAGNSLEVIESVEMLRGNGPTDLVEITMELAVAMLLLGKVESDPIQARAKLDSAISSGAALKRFERMVELQGGSIEAVRDYRKLPGAEIKHAVIAERSGFVTKVDAEGIGRACIVLGAGRLKTDDKVDFAVGVSELCKIGDRVDKGSKLLTIHANDRSRLDEALRLIGAAVIIEENKKTSGSLIVERLGDQ